MKSTGRNVGSVNLNGKKSKTLSCGCCEAQDFRERELEREQAKEMLFYTEEELEVFRQQLRDGIEEAGRAVKARGVRKLHPRLRKDGREA